MENALTCPHCATPVLLNKLRVSGTPCEHLVYLETQIEYGSARDKKDSARWHHPSIGEPGAKAKDVLGRLVRNDFSWKGSPLEIGEKEWFVGEDEYHLAANAIFAGDAQTFAAELSAAAK